MTISGVHAMLKRNNITLVVPCTLLVKGDPIKKKAFKQHLEFVIKNIGDDEKIFFQDESTFCQSGIPRRVWAVKGAKPTLPIYGTYSKLNVFGMINPISGTSHFSFIKKLNGDCFIQFLKLILKEYPNSKKIYVIVDNAPGYRAKKVEKFLEKFLTSATLSLTTTNESGMCPETDTRIPNLIQDARFRVPIPCFFSSHLPRQFGLRPVVSTAAIICSRPNCPRLFLRYSLKSILPKRRHRVV